MLIIKLDAVDIGLAVFALGFAASNDNMEKRGDYVALSTRIAKTPAEGGMTEITCEAADHARLLAALDTTIGGVAHQWRQPFQELANTLRGVAKGKTHDTAARSG